MQEELFQFKANLTYVMNFRTARDVIEGPHVKKTKKQKNKRTKKQKKEKGRVCGEGKGRPGMV